MSLPMMKSARLVAVLFCLTVLAAHGQGPVGDWDFTSQDSIVPDKSGNGNDLHVQDCRSVEGKNRRVLSVPLEKGRVWCEAPSKVLSPTQALGVIAWVRPLGTEQYCAVVRHGNGWGEEGTTGYRLLLYQDGVGFLLKAGRVMDISGGKFIRGQWHEVAASYNG